MSRSALICVSLLLWGNGPTAVAAEFPKFEHKTIDAQVGEICYAVTVADVDGDSRTDIIAVTEREVLWYRNPDWKRHVVISDQTVRDNVCIAAHDIDRDGSIDFALGAGWTGTGTLQWLSRGESLDQPWNVHLIGSERWTHRMRFADVLGRGEPQLVVSPLNKTVGEGVRLLAFQIPERPRTDRWPSDVISDNLNRMHNHWHFDIDDDGDLDTVTASVEGVHWIRRDQDQWNQFRIGTGIDGAATGAGEVKSGTLAKGHPFLVTVEPMHGTTVAVYVASNDRTQPWKRIVIEEELRRGHAVWTGDVDQDGSDEILIGHSDPGPGQIKGPGLMIFDCVDQDAQQWTRHIIDNGGIACEDAVLADLDGDGWLDIVAGGRATHNLKLYRNLGTR